MSIRSEIITIAPPALAELLSPSEFQSETARDYGLWPPDYPSPELFRFVIPHLLAIGAKQNTPPTALDLGPGDGREAIALALHGIQVTLVEKMPQILENLRNVGKDTGLPWRIVERNFISSFPKGKFDCVILKSSLNHTPKPQAVACLNNAFDAVRPGGIIFIRVNTRQSDSFWEHAGLSPQNPAHWRPEFDTVYDHCYCYECEGEDQSPITVFQTGEVVREATTHGFRILHRQAAPATGFPNTMYGQDSARLESFYYSSIYDNPMAFSQFGIETLIAIKPNH